MSVMASGMGMPSMGIDSYELFNFYGVENILRVGSVGALSEKVACARHCPRAQGACTNLLTPHSSVAAARSPRSRTTACRAPPPTLPRSAVFSCTVGNLLSSDTFYDDDKTANAAWIKMGVTRHRDGSRRALSERASRASHHLHRFRPCHHRRERPPRRQNSFREMMELALEVAVRS